MSIPDIGNLHTAITPVGSRVTCNPAPTDTDRDWLVLVTAGRFDDFADALEAAGWVVGGSRIPNEANRLASCERFNSFVKGIDNIIATESPDFHSRFLAASTLARRFNLLDKKDRISLFQGVLYGNMCDALDTVYPTLPESIF